MPVSQALIVRSRSGAAIRVGTAGWTDPTLTAPGVFYPASATSAENRLRYYASRFPVVEVDSPFYALPSRRSAELWVDRTPEDFTFNVKANALMTGHATDVARLPRELRQALPTELREKQRVYAKDLPSDVTDAVWEWFVDALGPLHAAGKLGAVLLQYPRWFVPSRESRHALVEAKQRLGDHPAAIEFRNRRWLTGPVAERTLAFLTEHDLPFVAVDEPQGMASSVPPIMAVTSPRLALVRLHGRRAETWEQRNVSVAERYRYLYTQAELEEWLPRVRQAADEAREVHVLYNNCYANYGTTNALEFMALLRERALQE
ncbi:MAG TPA: DUF72 domain-containing protein [Gemmatimonadales bacterium]|nr:DUF72 domain-containing protein [Gemmatimonadales bacterium]